MATHRAAPGTSDRQEYTERHVLRALCALDTTVTERFEFLEKLAHYQWGSRDHAVVYKAILRCQAGNAAGLRGELPAIATRMGFPDIDWGNLWGDFGPTVGEISALQASIQELLRYGAVSGE